MLTHSYIHFFQAVDIKNVSPNAETLDKLMYKIIIKNFLKQEKDLIEIGQIHHVAHKEWA